MQAKTEVKKKKKGIEEQKIQCQIVDWVETKYPDIFVMANRSEQQCTAYWRNLGKRMGCKSDVPDLFFPKGNASLCGLWLEVKTLKGRARPGQIQFIKDRIEEGYAGHFGYGLEECKMIIRSFYSLLPG